MKRLPKPAIMVAVRMSVTSGMLRSSATWQSSSTLIMPPDKASRSLFETRYLSKSGARLNALIEESRRPAPRRGNHHRRLDRQTPAYWECHGPASLPTRDAGADLLLRERVARERRRRRIVSRASYGAASLPKRRSRHRCRAPSLPGPSLGACRMLKGLAGSWRNLPHHGQAACGLDHVERGTCCPFRP